MQMRFSPRSGGTRLVALVFALLVATGGSTLAQESADNQEMNGLPAGEVGRLLDAYATMRAQEMLALTEQQYGPFVQQFRRLQAVRRGIQADRTRLLLDVQRMTRADANPSDAALRQALADLNALDVRARDENTRAVAALDGILSLRQQVRFRVFEEQMERRKLELMQRARQTVRRGGARR